MNENTNSPSEEPRRWLGVSLGWPKGPSPERAGRHAALALTGQRKGDRIRRTVAVGTIAAVTPIIVPSVAIWASWDSEVVAVLAMCSTIVAAAIVAFLLLRITRRLSRQEEFFDQERRMWRDEANTDPLCGIANRRGAYDQVAHLSAGAAADTIWTVLALDIDHFKEVNDTHGHAVGDRVLAAVASVLDEHVPPGATVARWGGDEFVVFALGERDLPRGWAEMITEAVSKHPVRCREGVIRVGISFGLAHGSSATKFDDVLASADAALLQAKERIRVPIRLDQQEGPAGRERLPMGGTFTSVEVLAPSAN